MIPIITDQICTEEIFTRGIVAEILPSRAALFEFLRSGKRLKIYLGADPTSGSLHLSHAKNYWFLEDLRQLGHEVIVLIGDFTARIGDPSDRQAVRPSLTPEQIKTNVDSWLAQLKLLLDFSDPKNPPRLSYNSAWLDQLTLKEIINLAANFTVQQMLERDMFVKRLADHTPIHLHEFLYPMLQGYDSVALEVNAELCGTDQIFNALAGRTLLKRLKNQEKFVIALNLLANPKTGELMSKSRGTGVFLSAPPNEMYGAIMAEPDEMIEPLFINCTRLPLADKEKIMSLGPRAAKARVTLEIVKKIYGAPAAQAAEKTFDQTFRAGGVPEDILEINLSPAADIVAALIVAGVIDSRSEWRRLIAEGAIRDETNQKITDPHFSPTTASVLKIGKHRFVKLSVK
ncbi:MAG TPA: tyrosine--tRNA ligase [Candidatus Paceibacterota bacterium]